MMKKTMSIFYSFFLNRSASSALFLFFFTAVAVFSAGKTTVPSQFETVKRQLGDPLWKSVIPGKTVEKPRRASFGFVCAAENRTLYAYDGSGNRLWQARLEGKLSAPFTVNTADFTYVITNSNILSVYNPGGNKLWSVQTPFEILFAPKSGADGRVIVQGKSGIACYGMNGTRKWHYTYQNTATIEPLELNDGSLVRIYQKEAGISGAIRLSPYGEQLEELTFTGMVSVAKEIASGVLLGFSDGTAGCIGVQNNKALTLWSQRVPAAPLFLIEGSALCLALGSDSSLTALNAADGTIAWKGMLPFAANSVSEHYYSGGLFYFFSGKTLCAYGTDGSPAGWYEFSAKTADTVLCTGTTRISFFQDDWTITTYQVFSSVYKEKLVKTGHSYGTTLLPVVPPGTLQKTVAVLSKIDYANREAEAQRAVRTWLTEYTVLYESSADTPITGHTLAAEMDSICRVLELLESAEQHDLLSIILQKETDPALLSMTLGTAGKLGFDPDRCLLDAMRTIPARIPRHNTRVFVSLINSVYTICAYMGKPAFFSTGKDIIADFLGGAYRNTVHQSAVQALEKMISLDAQREEQL